MKRVFSVSSQTHLSFTRVGKSLVWSPAFCMNRMAYLRDSVQSGSSYSNTVSDTCMRNTVQDSKTLRYPEKSRMRHQNYWYCWGKLYFLSVCLISLDTHTNKIKKYLAKHSNFFGTQHCISKILNLCAVCQCQLARIHQINCLLVP